MMPRSAIATSQKGDYWLRVQFKWAVHILIYELAAQIFTGYFLGLFEQKQIEMVVKIWAILYKPINWLLVGYGSVLNAH